MIFSLHFLLSFSLRRVRRAFDLPATPTQTRKTRTRRESDEKEDCRKLDDTRANHYKDTTIYAILCSIRMSRYREEFAKYVFCTSYFEINARFFAYCSASIFPFSLVFSLLLHFIVKFARRRGRERSRCSASRMSRHEVLRSALFASMCLGVIARGRFHVVKCA